MPRTFECTRRKLGFSPDGRFRRPRTSPTPLTAGTGPRDSQADYALPRRAAARRVKPPSTPKGTELRAGVLVPPYWDSLAIGESVPEVPLAPLFRRAGLAEAEVCQHIDTRAFAWFVNQR